MTEMTGQVGLCGASVKHEGVWDVLLVAPAFGIEPGRVEVLLETVLRC